MESYYWRKKAKKRKQFEASANRLLVIIALIFSLVMIGGFVMTCVTSEDAATVAGEVIDGMRDAHELCGGIQGCDPINGPYGN